MKKAISLFLALAVLLSLCACGNASLQGTDADEHENKYENTKNTENNRDTQPTVPNQDTPESTGVVDSTTQPSTPDVSDDQLGSIGLEYGFIEDGSACYVIGTGSCEDTDIIIPGEYQGVPVIAVSGFEGCENLTSVTILDGVVSIYEDAFSDCENLKSITISATVTNIEDNVFRYCASLESIVVSPENPTYHSDGNCLIETADKRIILGCKTSTIPADGSVTSIEEKAFAGCSGLTSITIPGTVADIYKYAFKDCVGLTNITLSEGVSDLAKGVFSNCTSLTSIVIPNSIRSIPEDAFSGCTSLAEIKLPDSVHTIYGRAFSACTSLKSITIPNSVEAIYGYTFLGCTSLESITIPSSVVFIGTWIFLDCTNLKSIFCVAEHKPQDWEAKWCDQSQTERGDAIVYWSGEWEYIDGVPTAK